MASVEETQLLGRIQRGTKTRPRRTMLYGVEGVGKSTFGSMAPNPIFLPTEDGLDHIDAAKFPQLRSWTEFMQAMRELFASPGEFRTIVVDSLDWLERLIWADVCEEYSVSNIESIGYAKGYVYAMSRWTSFLDACGSFRDEHEMAVLFIAHSQIERFEDPTNPSYDRYGPRLHKKASPLVREWCDEVLFATYEVFVKSHDEGFNKTRATAVGEGSRVMYTTERPSHMAKNRLRLPDKLPLDYREYAKFFQHQNTEIDV